MKNNLPRSGGSGFVLISVFDKTGILDFAQGLLELGFPLLSTGGSAAWLRQNGLEVLEVSEYTGLPEMLDGRVKTLHPKIHGGILARRELPKHMSSLQEHAIACIDLVVVNLYPFAQTVAKDNCKLEDAIENIDIGGPALLRAAAKNHGSRQGGVGVVVDPNDYDQVLAEIRQAEQAGLSYETRFALAKKAFTYTARYDMTIANWLTSLNEQNQQQDFPEQLHLAFERMEKLRYGENPHQQAAFYRQVGNENTAPATDGGLVNYAQLQGKQLSFNNITDADAAWECVQEFSSETLAACVIVKHANPCGAALAETPLAAYYQAFKTDPTSAFGGIIAFNQKVDEATARAVSEQFAEVIIAPDFSPEALELFNQKKNLRLLQVPLTRASGLGIFDYKRVSGGLLVQDRDRVAEGEVRVVSKRSPTEKEKIDLNFAWKVAKYVKSNAIVYCHDLKTVGVGAGQMSRVDSARIAALKAENNGLSLRGAVAASDAFFPFRDGLDVLAQLGATAVIQPGGSVRDAEVIAAADEQDLAMVFTGMRHFRH